MLIRLLTILILSLAPVICSSQECLTWGEIYDYEVGDVFHFTEHGEWVTWPWGYYDKLSNIQVIGKTFSENLDTIHYVMSVKQNYRSSHYPEWEYSALIKHYYYQYLIHPISCDTSYINNLYNGRQISYRFYYSHGIIAQIEEEFALGCGQVTLYEEDIDPERKFIRTKSLVYFKKGDEEWGEPIVLIGIEDYNSTKNSIKIFPNPASEYFTIASDIQDKLHQIQIFNKLGKPMITEKDGLDKVDISHLNTGLYIVKIQGDDWTVSRKLIVQ